MVWKRSGSETSSSARGAPKTSDEYWKLDSMALELVLGHGPKVANQAVQQWRKRST